MTNCTFCNENVEDGNAFCISCGAPVQSISVPDNNVETGKNNNNSTIVIKKGKLVFPDSSMMEIDSSHRLVGRVNLRKFSSKDHALISRGQFTVYLESEKYYLKDGRTNVQDKASTNHTILNGDDITGKDKFHLKDGDTIQISDVKILFKEGN